MYLPNLGEEKIFLFVGILKLLKKRAGFGSGTLLFPIVLIEQEHQIRKKIKNLLGC
jgi:hypothetical protein